ncbi:Nramp-domain-containing protein [Rhizophagus irregularis]|uniref:Nramp-domain-containing protein n=1 Tax=Rhizophagus irregularis TaxID=588596 RepID=A0A2I1H0G7_9GLOM|nr:Nramp-domain-containing protein [Rhizophagus irregularis]
MPPQEVTSDVVPLIQRSSLDEVINAGEDIDDSNVTHGLVHGFVEFNDKLIEAEVDTGEIQPKFSWKKLWKYTGPGFLMSIAYLDPGNLEADLQSGAAAGYSLLWLLLYAHIAGLLIQILSARCGVVTGKHLAQLIKIYYSRPVSIVLWLFTEIAIIGSDIQEIVGTAIAIKILFGLPLWVGTMLTAMDTFTFMLLQNYGVRKLEAFFMALIALMAVCFWIEMFQSEPNVGGIVKGMLIPTVPSSAVVQAVAMIGAVIMPHNLYLHSALVMTRKTDHSSKAKLKEANFYFSIESTMALFCSYLINMAIVVVFAQVFYIPSKSKALKTLPGLYDAADVLTKTLGRGARYLWALGLLSAGQSSTMTGTLAGQYVMEGYFGKIFSKSWHRVAITRGVALVPSMLVALFAVDHFDTMGELLNVLQSLCLPCALIPILKLTSSKEVMGNTFRSYNLWKYVTWSLAFTIIFFNLFLFIIYLEELPNIYVGYICGIIYFAFVLYIVILPLDGKQEVLDIDEMDGYKVMTNHSG